MHDINNLIEVLTMTSSLGSAATVVGIAAVLAWSAVTLLRKPPVYVMVSATRPGEVAPAVKEAVPDDEPQLCGLPFLPTVSPPRDPCALREDAMHCDHPDNLHPHCINPVRDCLTRNECQGCVQAAGAGPAEFRAFVDSYRQPLQMIEADQVGCGNSALMEMCADRQAAFEAARQIQTGGDPDFRQYDLHDRVAQLERENDLLCRRLNQVSDVANRADRSRPAEEDEAADRETVSQILKTINASFNGLLGRIDHLGFRMNDIEARLAAAQDAGQKALEAVGHTGEARTVEHEVHVDGQVVVHLNRDPLAMPAQAQVTLDFDMGGVIDTAEAERNRDCRATTSLTGYAGDVSGDMIDEHTAALVAGAIDRAVPRPTDGAHRVALHRLVCDVAATLGVELPHDVTVDEAGRLIQARLAELQGRRAVEAHVANGRPAHEVSHL